MDRTEPLDLPGPDAWCEWLDENHATASGVWLVQVKKGAKRPGVTYDEALEEALRFGWIDSKAASRDEETFLQRWSPRKRASGWSKANRSRAERLIAEGRMTPAGLAAVEEAKRRGSWAEAASVPTAKPPWTAEVALSPEEARLLILAQFPELAPARVELLGSGWDYWAFLVNGHLVFRFPRRAMVANVVEREWGILPLLAPHLPLAVPVPRFLGEPGRNYPYPFLGHELIPGTDACRVRWRHGAREQAGVLLARFLARLHRIPVQAADLAWAPGDELGRADLEKRLRPLQERLERMAPSLGEERARHVGELASELAATPPFAGAPVWVHGDLYACQVLVNDSLQPTGVLDWVDVHLGDPALDLALAFGFLPPAGRASFRAAYGPIEEAAWSRARFRALGYGLTLMEYGREIGDDHIRRAGGYGLRVATERE